MRKDESHEEMDAFDTGQPLDPGKVREGRAKEDDRGCVRACLAHGESTNGKFIRTK